MKKHDETDEQLKAAAIKVRENAYSKYSDFKVGAALVDNVGNVHIGCNVENSAYPQGHCAETGAIAAMISSGGKSIQTIAVVGGHDELVSCTPCGGCRQRINEFADDETRILVIDDGEWQAYTIADLLPHSFHLG